MEPDNTSAQQWVRKLDRVTTKLLIGICDKWGLTEEEIAGLADVAVPQIQSWREALAEGRPITLPEVVRTKASHLASIYKWRQLVIQSDRSDRTWIRHENPDLQGRAPVEYLVSGSNDDLIVLKQYLQGWFETPYL